MSDLIDRQEALYVLDEFQESVENGTPCYAKARIEMCNLPSEPQWIPCSERLPEVDELVLVTDDSGGVKTVDVDRCGEYEASSKRFWYYAQNVVAWMSLPEPYKEVE